MSFCDEHFSPAKHRGLRISVALGFLVLGFLSLWGCGDSSSPDGKGSVEASASSGAGEDGKAEEALVERDVVLITVDTLRFDALSFSAAPGESPSRWATPTPHLGRLAQEGRVFTRAVAHTPLTLPSHASMLTGLYPYENGVRENAGFVLDQDFETLPEILQDKGYRTGAFVSAYVLNGRFGLAQGFDVYGDRIQRSGTFQVSERPGDETVEEALAWWREDASAPRFLWLHLFDPHAPYAPAPDFQGRHEHPYQDEIAAVDAYLGPLLDEVRTSDKKPLVIFTSDHGEALGDHGEQTHGIFAYQSTLQVPLVLWGEGVDPGRDGRLARHVDLLPTVLESIGLGAPSELPGCSLLAPPEASVEMTESYFEALSGALNRGWAPLRGTFRDELKYIDLPLPELYDLDADPGETDNLVNERRRDLQALRSRLPEESEWPPPRRNLSSEETARLRSLGYLTGDGGKSKFYGKEDDPKNLVGLDTDIHRFSELFAAGKLDEAVNVAESLVEARPSMGVAHSQLAQALLEAGRVDDALAAMSTAVNGGWAGPSLKRQYGLTLLEKGRVDEAASVLRPLAESDDPEAMGALAMALTESLQGSPSTVQAEERVEESKGWLKKALVLSPEDAGLREKAAVAALRRGDNAEALVQARKAKELNPESATAWNQYGVALYLQGRPMEALEAWQRSVALDPDQFDTLFNLGTKAVELGRPDLARRYLEDFARRAPEDRYAQDLPRVRQWLQQQ